MAIVAYPKESTTYNTSSDVFTVPRPADATAGRVVLIKIYTRNGTTTVITPPDSSFVLQRRDNSTTVLASATYTHVVAATGEPTEYTFGISPSQKGIIVARTYSGVDTTTPINVINSAIQTATNTPASPSITPTVNDCMLVFDIALQAPSTVAPPAGFAEFCDVDTSDVNGGNVGQELAEQLLTGGAGVATGAKSPTINTTTTCITTIMALQPGAVVVPTSGSVPPTYDLGFLYQRPSDYTATAQDNTAIMKQVSIVLANRSQVNSVETVYRAANPSMIILLYALAFEIAATRRTAQSFAYMTLAEWDTINANEDNYLHTVPKSAGWTSSNRVYNASYSGTHYIDPSSAAWRAQMVSYLSSAFAGTLSGITWVPDGVEWDNIPATWSTMFSKTTTGKIYGQPNTAYTDATGLFTEANFLKLCSDTVKYWRSQLPANMVYSGNVINVAQDSDLVGLWGSGQLNVWHFEAFKGYTPASPPNAAWFNNMLAQMDKFYNAGGWGIFGEILTKVEPPTDALNDPFEVQQAQVGMALAAMVMPTDRYIVLPTGHKVPRMAVRFQRHNATFMELWVSWAFYQTNMGRPVAARTTIATNKYKRSFQYYDVTLDFTDQTDPKVYSATFTQTATPPSDTAPAAPTGLAVSLISYDRATYTWADVSGETEYIIYRSINGGSYQQIARLAANTTTYLDTPLIPASNYSVIVAAYNTAGETSSAAVNYTTSAAPAPTLTTPGLSMSAVTPQTVTLAIGQTADTKTAYILERATNGGPFTQLVSLGEVASYTDTTVNPATSYQYRVKATNGTAQSAYSATVSAQTPPAQITNPDTPIYEGEPRKQWIRRANNTRRS